ncbi:uncharacterized protein HaLaN_03313, partial [Haematococcus lacustris]
MSLQPPLLYQGPGAQPLAVMLAELEGCLRSSCKAHTRACHRACGVMQADKWVASFPVMSIQLVDSVVWTQSVTAALTRASSGERAAMRNLLDQSVLRLETMARQLRAAQAASAEASELAVTSLAAVAAAESVGSGR